MAVVSSFKSAPKTARTNSALLQKAHVTKPHAPIQEKLTATLEARGVVVTF